MKHTLYMSLRSPFARRVRLALEELGVPYDTVLVDVFNLPPGYYDINPLGRVPVLKTPRGAHIIDSWMILDHLRANFPDHALFQHGASYDAELRSLSGLVVGVMEQVVASYLERLRGPGLSSPEVLEEALGNINRAYEALERRVSAQKSEYLTGSVLRLCDLDLGSALGYTELRLAGVCERFPALRAYYQRLLRRESFRKTVPPA